MYVCIRCNYTNSQVSRMAIIMFSQLLNKCCDSELAACYFNLTVLVVIRCQFFFI